MAVCSKLGTLPVPAASPLVPEEGEFYTVLIL